MLALQAARLVGFLPEPPEAWTREVDASSAEGMAPMGMAGNAVEACDQDAEGNGFTLTLTADSPLVAQMAGILANPQMIAAMGKMVTVAGHDMLDQDGALSAMVGGRVLVQAQGANSATMQSVLGTVDFSGLAHYDA